jgi:GT2 family glycosyltransferase
MGFASQRAALDLRSQPWQMLYAAAERAVEQGHWLAAEPLLQQVLEQVPSHAAAHHLLGKVWREQERPEAALEAQQRSCALDPSLGWNWFAAGELLLEQERWPEAVQAFEQAQAALPAEGWIREQLATARFLACCEGEDLAAGVGPNTYRHWIAHHEPRLPPASEGLHEPFWCLEPLTDGQQGWRALHSSTPLQPRRAPLGQSPWPTDGWLVLLGEGARLRPGALQAVESWLAGDLPEQRAAQLVNQLSPLSQPSLLQPDLIYSDEDRLDATGHRIDPWFKPGWVEESFWSSPWLGALSLWRMSWLRHAGLPLPPADAQGRWRWQLAALEQRPQISHVPLVLVHAGPALQPDPEALRQHLQRQGEAIAAVQPHRQLAGCLALQWQLPQRWSCSVIIPTRDRADLLEQCLVSLWNTTADARAAGLDLEILVVDNGSIEPATEGLLQRWQPRIQVLCCNEPFNWSRLNNLAAAQATGELLLLLNNDIEATQPGWLEAMAAQALRPQVGCVGAVLLYPDGTIQHGGVVVGLHSGADHAYRDLEPDHGVHRGRSRLLTGWGAVTGACLMVRRVLLAEVGGLDEGLPVEFNDVDLCVRLGQLGYRHVVPPEAVLVHHESQSRDAEESTTALQALLRVQRRWHGRFSSAAPWWPAQSERNCADGRPIGLKDLPV